MIQRRSFIKFASLPILMSGVAACGGGDGDTPYPSTENGDVITDPGVDPRTLKNYPQAIEVDYDFLQETTSQTIRCSVMLGTEPIKDAEVFFYDVTGKIIGRATTDANGQAQTNIAVRRMVAAAADTPYGTLYGMRFYAGYEYQPVLYVDILQSVFVELAKTLKDQANVSVYLLQDYFGLPHETNIFNIGHNYPALDQQLLEQDWRASGKSLENYINDLRQDILDKVDDAVYENLKFNRIYNNNNLRLMSGGIPHIDEELFDLVGDKVVDIIAEAIPIPFSSLLLKYGFGKLKDKLYPGNDGPFVELTAQLVVIESKLIEFKQVYSENEWLRVKEKIMDRFASFVAVKINMDDLQKQIQDLQKENPEGFDPEDLRIYEIYYTGLLELTDINKAADQTGEAKLKSALDYLMGENTASGKIPLDIFFDLLREKKFYSSSAEQMYRGYLAFLMYHQSMGYLLLSLSTSLRCIQENRSESYLGNELRRLKGELEKAIARIKKLDVEPLPERVNIDYKSKLAWIGSCGLIQSVNDFWPPNRQACSHHTVRSMSLDGTSFYPAFACVRYENGRGLPSWQGPDPERQLARTDAYVSEATKAFGAWRNPSESEFKGAFIKDAHNQNVEPYAASQGFSCVLKEKGVNLNAFNNFPFPGDNYRSSDLPDWEYKDGLALVPTQYRRAGYAGDNGSHYYLDCSCIDIKNKSVASRNVRNNYGIDGVVANKNPSRYVFFPTCNVPQTTLEKHVPWIKLGRNT